MAKNPNDQWKVAQPDFIPEGEEYLYPHRGGVFCDFIPEKCTIDDVRGEKIEPIPPHIDAELDEILIEANDEKKGKKSA